MGVFLEPPDDDDPLTVEVRRLAVRPGDCLVLKFDRNLFPEEAAQIEAAVARLFEGWDCVPKVLILEAGVEIGVVGPEDGI